MDNDYKYSTGRWRHHRGHQRPDCSRRRDAPHWADLIAKSDATDNG